MTLEILNNQIASQLEGRSSVYIYFTEIDEAATRRKCIELRSKTSETEPVRVSELVHFYQQDEKVWMAAWQPRRITQAEFEEIMNFEEIGSTYFNTDIVKLDSKMSYGEFFNKFYDYR